MEAPKTLALKNLYRNRLKEPLGKIYPDIGAVLAEMDLKGKKIISVGDQATKNLLERGISPMLGIVDYMIQRQPVGYTYSSFKLVLKAKNPPGKITPQAWEAVSKALKKQNVLLEIEGEEDLLVLPVMALAGKGALIFYGQPEDGLVLVEMTKKSKEYAKTLLDACFSTE